MNLNAASLFDLIKTQIEDKPACVLTIYRWFFEKGQHVTVDVPLIDKIRHLEGDGFKFTLAHVYSEGKKSRYLRTDLMIAFPNAVSDRYVLGGRVPEAMSTHLEKTVGLFVYKTNSKLEDEEAA